MHNSHARASSLTGLSLLLDFLMERQGFQISFIAQQHHLAFTFLTFGLDTLEGPIGCDNGFALGVAGEHEVFMLYLLTIFQKFTHILDGGLLRDLDCYFLHRVPGFPHHYDTHTQHVVACWDFVIILIKVHER